MSISANLTLPPCPAVYLLLGSLPLLVLSESKWASHTGTALFKMLSSLAFLSGPLFLTSTEWSSYRQLITIGLLFSFAGDFFLIPSREEFYHSSSSQEKKKISVSFQLGIIAFAAAHITYIFAFMQKAWETSWLIFGTSFLLTMLLAKWLGVIYVRPGFPACSNILDLFIDDDLKPLVAIYAVIISLMFATAVSTPPMDVSSGWPYQQILGASMFVASDVFVAKDAFKKTPGRRGWVQSAFGFGLYFWGQMMIAGLVEL